jgi:hypothetical protein
MTPSVCRKMGTGNTSLAGSGRAIHYTIPSFLLFVGAYHTPFFQNYEGWVYLFSFRRTLTFLYRLTEGNKACILSSFLVGAFVFLF